MIEEFVREICDMLEIEMPEISYNASAFPTRTTMALCSSTGDTIFIRRKKTPTMDQMLAIAHELRHIWQLQYDQKTYFSSFLPIEMCASMDVYNAQPAEVDAHAFSALAMATFFQIRPIFDTFSPALVEKINARMEEILEEMEK